MNKLNKDNLIDRIKQLIDVTEVLVNFSIELKKLHSTYSPDDKIKRGTIYAFHHITLLIRFLHRSLFDNVLLNLNTLLHKFEQNLNKKEISFFELVALESNIEKKNKLENELNELKRIIELNGLNKWRNKLIAHKDVSTTGDYTVIYLNFIKEEVLNLACDIVKQLKKILIENFDTNFNNEFEDFYRKSFNFLYSVLENELKKLK